MKSPYLNSLSNVVSSLKISREVKLTLNTRRLAGWFNEG